jgi:leucyl-tRNA synthetase
MVLSNGKKMSKRGGNVVSPVSVIEKFGADTARMFVMFAGPPDGDIEWSDEQVQGCARFLHRVWKLAQTHVGAAGAKFEGEVTGDALAIRRVAHKCLKRVTESMEKLSFNTAIAGIMESTNAWNDIKATSGANVDAAWAEAMQFLAVCLSPFAPHLADELAQAFGSKSPLQSTAWPEFDPKLVVDDTVKYAIQVNGKLRGEVETATGAGQDEVVAAARAVPGVAAQLEGKVEKKVVFVPKRLVNFVVAG